MGDFTPPQRLSKENTPCLDENRIDDDNGGDNSKEIELSDISDEEENLWLDNNNDDVRKNGNGDQFKFKRLTRGNRDRNYRENANRKTDRRNMSSRLGAKRIDNSRRKEIERYNVRKVIANREFSISRSRSRTHSPHRHRRGSYSPRRRSISPKTSRNKSHYYSPISPSRHSPSPSPDRKYPRNYQQYNKRSQSPQEKLTSSRRSRSKHKHKTSEGKRKKHRSKEHQHKHISKKSRSRSKRHSSSPSPLSPSRQIVANNTNLPVQENIKIILKNDDAKRHKIKKREKKLKKEKSVRKLEVVKEKTQKELLQTKEVFASGDNILISVCFNNNNNNSSKNIISSSNNNHVNASSNGEKSKEVVVEEKIPKIKSKKRQASPNSSISSLDSFEQQRRQRKQKRKKSRTKKDQRGASKEPKTPPLIPPTQIQAPTAVVKRKNDAKPVAIIDLEKSPGKEITQSPKEVIVLSDSDGEGKKRDKDIIIVEDVMIIEKSSNIIRNHSPPVPPQPVLKFALKSKSNILPFNLLHDQADEIEELPQGNQTSLNTANNLPSINSESKNLQKEQETASENLSNQNEAYNPFEPTKSRSTSPVTPPHPHPNDISNETLKKKVDLFNEKKADQIPCIDEHPMWMRKDYESKKSQPVTPPLPPSFMFSSSGSHSKQVSSLYDGIYSNDLKTPVIASPAKPNMKSSKDDDDRTPYSPSSDGYDYEPASGKGGFDNTKLSDIDTQSSEPSGSFSFGADDTTNSKTPLKLTASTLKTFNSTMTRSTGPVGLQYVNKAELSIFENYLAPQQQKSPLVKRQTNATTSSSSFMRSKMSRFLNNENGSPHRLNYGSTSDALKPPVIDDSMLDDDVPSSAVDLVNKDRFLKKSLRIERVAEEVKMVLKPHYNKKHITKEEYKEILRKAVPKICHNKTGEINVQKITQLIEAYIKKFRYKRKVGIASTI